jgi:uncharacterized protein
LLEHCRPDIIIDRLDCLDQAELQRRGIRGIIVDLDNTLCPWGSREISAERRAWVEQARSQFGLCILSNTFKGRRVKAVGADLALPTVARWACGRKPFPGGFRAAMGYLGTTPEQTVMVGDQLFADILGGNRLGLLTVWVQRLDEREFFTTKLVRTLERWTLRRLGIDPDSACGKGRQDG